jgi:hypothetical protein
MSFCHFIMQGKGGVGKSLVASLLFQYIQKRGYFVYGCDTDPVNASFAAYKSFGVKILDIMEGEDIAPGHFDKLMENIINLPEEAHLVVDIGASCFVALCSYLKKNAALDFLMQKGHEVTIHTVITGGQSLVETLNNLRSLARHFYDVPLMVWLNPYFGDITLDGEKFENFKVYQEVAASVDAVIEMPKLSKLFEEDFINMLTRHSTFEESVKDPKLHIMVRQRLSMIWCDYQKILDQAQVVPEPMPQSSDFPDPGTKLIRDGLS